ncbi:MAG: hypothetical protein KIG88_05070 [Weeksellaceae bacterium]|nr:hypothetical protein [Weeksellaceae bacterium]
MKLFVYFSILISFISCAVNQTIGSTMPNQQSGNTTTPSKTSNSNQVGQLTTIDNFKITNDLNPITLNVNVIVLKRDNKSQTNFDLKNAEEKQLLTEYFDKINTYWNNFKKPQDLSGCYTGTDFYNDSKIRFKFNFIELVDAYAWDYMNSGADLAAKKYNGLSPSENWYLKNLDKKLAADPTIPKGVFLYLTMEGKNFDELNKTKGKGFHLIGTEASQFPSTTNLERTSSVHVPNRYLKYLWHRYQAPIEHKTNWNDTRNWHLGDAVGTAHELGHTLGLSHSNEYHGVNKCQYSIMSQAADHVRNYLQPTEILKAHKNLRESNLIQFVTDDSFLGNTFSINKSETWSRKQRFYSNLKLEDQVILTITEPIILPPQAKVSFGKNAKIIFTKNGKLTQPNGAEFSNFVNKSSNSITKN